MGEDPLLHLIWLLQLATVVMDNLQAVLEFVLETTIFMKMILTKWTSLFPELFSMKTMILGPSKMISACLSLKVRLTSAAQQLDPFLFLHQWKNTQPVQTALSLDGEPPLRVEVLEKFS